MQNEHSLSTCLLEAQFTYGNYQITAFFEMLISIPSLNSSVHITLAALVLRWHSVHFCHRHKMPGGSSLKEDIFRSQFQELGVHHVDGGMVAGMAPSMAVEACTLTWSHLDKSEIRELKQPQKWVKHSRATPRKTSALISAKDTTNLQSSAGNWAPTSFSWMRPWEGCFRLRHTGVVSLLTHAFCDLGSRRVNYI